MQVIRVENADWKILGSDSEVVVLTLKPNEQVICEPGAMIARGDSIKATISAGTGGAWSAFSRWMFGGEKLLFDSFTNESNSNDEIYLGASFPGGTIIPIRLDQCTAMIMSPGAWLATKGSDINFDVTTVKTLYSGLFAGRGFVLPTISGSSPTFLCGGGTVLSFNLEPRQSIVIDATSFLACESSVDIKACPSGSIFMMMFGGESTFQCKLTGPGKVFLQSMPACNIAKTTAQAARMATGIKQKTA